MQVSDRFPDPERGDAGLVLSSEWVSRDKEAVARVIVDAWRDEPWPDGLLQYSICLDADGDLIRHYSQWTGREAYDAFVATGRDSRIRKIDLEVPGIVRRDFDEYRLYRGARTAGRTPGAIVVVRVDTDGPDVARTWIDAVFDALAGDGDLPAGGLGAYFHISADGTRVLNYAEWESAEAHRRAVAATGRGIAQGPLWDRVQSMPGVRPQSVTRFHLHATLTP